MEPEACQMVLTQDGKATIVDNARGWQIMSQWYEAPDTKPDGAKLEALLPSVDDFKELMDDIFTRFLRTYSEEFFEELAPYSPIGFQSKLSAAGSEHLYRVNVTMGKKKPMRFHRDMAFEEGKQTADGNRLYDIHGAVLFKQNFFYLMTRRLVKAGIFPPDPEI